MNTKRAKRPMTQREMAEKFSVSVSTVKRYISLEREQYEKEAKERRLKAFVLRESGLKWSEVGEKLGTSMHGAIALYKRYEKLDLNENRG